MKKLMKDLIKRFTPDIVKLNELRKLKDQHQHFETLEAAHNSCYQITQFGHSQNLARADKIAALERDLGL